MLNSALLIRFNSMLARNAIRRLFSLEVRRNAIRVENQGKTWNHQELDRHAEAFSLGIQELGLKPGSPQ